MNYDKALDKAQELLRQRHYGNAIQQAGKILEQLLEDLYHELLRQAPPGYQKQLAEALEQVGKGQPMGQLTMGRKMGVFRVADAYKQIEDRLGYSLTYFNNNNLEPLRMLRNDVTHNNYRADQAEASYVVHQVALILRETGRVRKEQPATIAEGPLQPWWQHAMPHQDIREGRLDLKIFAVDLAQVLEGDAVPEYKDAETYFRHTYLTRGLQGALTGVLQRLVGKDDGIAITQLATVFGGGKTHTLLGLYHIVAHGNQVAGMEIVEQILDEAELEQVPAARVAAVDCAHISPSQPRTTPEGITLHTLWGELAYRLGAKDGRGAEFYELVRGSDEARSAPGSEVLEALFAAAGPSLILIDETLSYITKASAIPVGRGYLSDQAHEFLLELTRAVNAADDVALVITMTASEEEQFGEAAIETAKEVESAIRVLRRTRQVEVSAEREELYEILKRRLFATDPAVLQAEGRQAANAYWDYYRKHGSDFPQEAQTLEYRHLIARAYPFHPCLIELLRDRWGSIQGFQRTRGVLRLLAVVIGDLYRRQQPAPMIQPAHVNLENGKIRAELLEYVDNRGAYEAAVLSDIGGTEESKAPYLDRVTGGDYARFHIATGLARSIFLYSHSGATTRAPAASRPQLWLATLRPGIVPALAADALDKLQKKLWYLTVDEGTYRIDSEPNLNQMLVSRLDAVRQEPERVREYLETAVSDLVGRGPFARSYIWPESPRAVEDRQALSLIVTGPEQDWGTREGNGAAARGFVQGVLANARSTFRQYKNTLVFLLPTAEGVRVMEQAAVRLLALEAIHRQYRSGGLSTNQLEQLRDDLDRARKGLPAAVWGAYTVIMAPNGSEGGETTLWMKQEHGIVGYRPGEHTLSGRAWERLLEDQRLLERLDPRLISEGKGDQWRLWPEAEEQINVAQLWDYFCRFPYLPMLSGTEALQQTIAWGVQRGLFAYALGDGETFDTVYFEEPRSAESFAIIEGAWLLRPEKAERLLQPEDTGEEEDEEIEVPVTGGTTPAGTTATSTSTTTTAGPSRTGTTQRQSTYQQLTIDTPLSWQDWYDFYKSVIEPLVNAGVEVKLDLHLDAEGELDMNLVDLSVRESVMQFNREASVSAE